jgi:hypothetical protein
MIYTLCNGDGIGLCGEIIQELYIVYLTRFRTYIKLLYHPRGPQTEKHLPPGPFTGQFFRKADILGLVSLQLFGPLGIPFALLIL